MNRTFKGWLSWTYCLLAVLLLFAGCHPAPIESGPSGGWHTLAVLPASNPFFVVALNRTLYVGTGAKNGTGYIVLSKLWQYDVAANAWRPKKDFPGKLEPGLSYFTVNEKLYVGFSGTGESDPCGQEGYSKDFYEYNPVIDEWKTVTVPNYRLGFGTTSLNYQNRGISLWGIYRTCSSLATKSNSDGVSYDATKGWGTVTLTIAGTTTFPAVPDNSFQTQLPVHRVIREKGFGFSINNRVYTGGGQIYQFTSQSPLYGYDSLRIASESHELYEFEGADSSAGLTLSIINRLQTPADYDLTLASQAFALKNTGYIITHNGKLVSITPGTSQWHKLDSLSSPLVVGTGLNDKAYFINRANQLIEYTPN